MAQATSLIYIVLEFPFGCELYEGPHEMQCLITSWKSAGCLREGSDFPESLTFKELARLRLLNLRYSEIRVRLVMVVVK